MADDPSPMSWVVDGVELAVFKKPTEVR